MIVDLTRFRWWPTDGGKLIVPGMLDGVPVSLRIWKPKVGDVRYIGLRDLRSSDAVG